MAAVKNNEVIMNLLRDCNLKKSEKSFIKRLINSTNRSSKISEFLIKKDIKLVIVNL